MVTVMQQCAAALMQNRFQAKEPVCHFPEPMVVCTVLN
jgi:hypothetical protein